MQQQAVFYADEDYVGVMRRLLIDVIDTLLASAGSLLVWSVIAALSPERFSALILVAAFTFVWIGYFVVLKGSRYRTIGYIIAGARIVDLAGARPSYGTLLGRLAFVVFGPANFVVDILWVSSDPRRQAIRDKVAHTFVVRNSATPVGAGRVVYGTYMMFGWTLLCAEVKGN